MTDVVQGKLDLLYNNVTIHTDIIQGVIMSKYFLLFLGVLGNVCLFGAAAFLIVASLGIPDREINPLQISDPWGRMFLAGFGFISLGLGLRLTSYLLEEKRTFRRVMRWVLPTLIGIAMCAFAIYKMAT